MAFQIRGTTIVQDTTNNHYGEGANSGQRSSTNIGKFAGGTGIDNVAVGYFALNGSSGTRNVAVGSSSLIDVTNGSRNTAIGYSSAVRLRSGSDNVVIGHEALPLSTTSSGNVVIGMNAMHNSNGPGSDSKNVAIGFKAMEFNTSSEQNVVIGYRAMNSGGVRDNSVIIGYEASSNSAGTFNTMVGMWSGRSGGVGGLNTFMGYASGSSSTGGQNTYLGAQAGNSSGSNNTAIGYFATTSSTFVSNEFVLGNSSVSNLRCNDTTISGLSDQRDKSDIVDLDWSVDFIKDMRPVKFAWNRRDGSMEGKKDMGFIAQELDVLEEKYSSHEYTRLVHKDNPDRWEADPLKTYPIVIKALQDLIDRIETLEKQINPT